MKRSLIIAIAMPLCAVSLSACASADWMPSFLRSDPPLHQATLVTDPAPRLISAEFTQPLPAPIPTIPKPAPIVPAPKKPPTARVNAANRAALQEPSADNYINAIQIYPYSDGALYQLYAAPQEVSDIALQPGENLTAISAGDTTRWVVGNTTSGSGATRQVHILAKPFAAGLKTNLVITTDRRSYHLQLESTPHTFMAALSWTYPQDSLIAQQPIASTPAIPADGFASIENLHFDYAISGDTPPWKPVRAFDDGTHVYIEFPTTISQGEAPPLFVSGPGGNNDLVNYRVHGNYYIVDQLFESAELRLGQDHQQVVRIKRTGELRTADAHTNQTR
jgi:type IV secretion system protein VirB9